jgi:hypothetical protein
MFRDKGRERWKNQSHIRNVRRLNEFPQPEEFRLRLVVGWYWRNECAAIRVNLELTGKTPSIQVTGSGPCNAL